MITYVVLLFRLVRWHWTLEQGPIVSVLSLSILKFFLFVDITFVFSLGHHVSRGHLVASYRSGRIAMASGGAALVCFSHRALAGLPSPLLEINYHSRLSKAVDLLENKRPRLWPIYGRTLDLSFLT